MEIAKNIVREQLRPFHTATPRRRELGSFGSFLWFAHWPRESLARWPPLSPALLPRASAAFLRRFLALAARLCSPRRETLKHLHDAESVMIASRFLSRWPRIERSSSADCSAGPLKSVSDQRAFKRLHDIKISTRTQEQQGNFPVWHLARSLMGACR